MNRIESPNEGGTPRTNQNPPVARTTEGKECIAVEANAERYYSGAAPAGKPSQEPRIDAVRMREQSDRCNMPKAAYRDSTGRIWAFTGKRGRVLELLATRGQGLTQWDCWPWHTRLGASIHVLREAGLAIDTLREGEYRHARYFLRTPGVLIEQAGSRGGGK